MKHKPVAINQVDLYNRINDANELELLYEIFDVTPDDLDNINPDEHLYCVVQWPEHVTTPRYNSDASYSDPKWTRDELVDPKNGFDDIVFYGEH